MSFDNSISSKLGLINNAEILITGAKEFGSTVYNNAKTIMENPESIFTGAVKGSAAGVIASKLGIAPDLELENAFVNAWNAGKENYEEQRAQGKQTLSEKASEAFKEDPIGYILKGGMKGIFAEDILCNKEE